jgi:large subunit ribosomal protein L7e
MGASVPSKSSIEVPESVLKKQKANAKADESRAADLKKKREVR